MTTTVAVKISGASDKEVQDKSKAIQILASNLDRDSLVILANKSGTPGVNAKIKQYQSFM